MDSEPKKNIVYAGYCSDPDVLRKCTSGGAADALSREILRRDGVVAGVAYSEDQYSAEYRLVDSFAVLPKLRGSKYIRAETGDIYSRTKAALDSGKTVLFTGLPCNIAALYSFLGGDRPGLYTCELICNGPTYPEVHRQYLEALEKKHGAKITSFSARYKKYGWATPYLRAEFSDGSVFEEEFYATAYGHAFRTYGYPGCYTCAFKGDRRTGDLMVGDLWGARQSDPYWNPDGLSVILVRTEKGEELLRSCESMKLFDYDYDRAIAHNKRIVSPNPKPAQRDRFAELFAQKGLFVAVKKTTPVKRRLKLTRLSMVPPFLKPAAQRAYHRKNTNKCFKE